MKRLERRCLRRSDGYEEQEFRLHDRLVAIARKFRVLSHELLERRDVRPESRSCVWLEHLLTKLTLIFFRHAMRVAGE